MEKEETEIVEEITPEENQIEAVSAGENENSGKPKRTKKEIRNLIIVGCIYGALVAITTTVLVIGFNSSSNTVTIPTTHLSSTAAGYYGEDRNLIASFSTEDVSLVAKEGYYSLASIKSKENAPYMVLPSYYDNVRIMHIGDCEEGNNIFGNIENSPAIKEIYFPNIYLTVGKNSFSSMTSLNYVSLAGSSEGRLTISEGAFSGCASLTSIELPKNLVGLGVDAFADCPSLTSIDFKGTKSVFEAIGDYEKAFSSDVTIKCTDGDIVINII